ncbi:tRNA(Ser) Um(44) 2'-O-methyltransferase [Gonapodya sp. JEL0774]|nr:tRNA(Ser) Um(44) 2'-O-methyltransferase [Gonapodya sp. JEL0774]
MFCNSCLEILCFVHVRSESAPTSRFDPSQKRGQTSRIADAADKYGRGKVEKNPDTTRDGKSTTMRQQPSLRLNRTPHAHSNARRFNSNAPSPLARAWSPDAFFDPQSDVESDRISPLAPNSPHSNPLLESDPALEENLIDHLDDSVGAPISSNPLPSPTPRCPPVCSYDHQDDDAIVAAVRGGRTGSALLNDSLLGDDSDLSLYTDLDKDLFPFPGMDTEPQLVDTTSHLPLQSATHSKHPHSTHSNSTPSSTPTFSRIPSRTPMPTAQHEPGSSSITPPSTRPFRSYPVWFRPVFHPANPFLQPTTPSSPPTWRTLVHVPLPIHSYPLPPPPASASPTPRTSAPALAPPTTPSPASWHATERSWTRDPQYAVPTVLRAEVLREWSGGGSGVGDGGDRAGTVEKVARGDKGRVHGAGGMVRSVDQVDTELAGGVDLSDGMMGADREGRIAGPAGTDHTPSTTHRTLLHRTHRRLLPKQYRRDPVCDQIVESWRWEDEEGRVSLRTHLTTVNPSTLSDALWQKGQAFEPVPFLGTVGEKGGPPGDMPFWLPRVRKFAFVYHLPPSYPPTSDPDSASPSTEAPYPSISVEVVPLEGDGEGTTVIDEAEAHAQTYRLTNLLLLFLRHLLGLHHGYTKRVHHDLAVPKTVFQDRYRLMKDKYARWATGDVWRKAGMKTDPAKHVYEDIGIAAWLLCVWEAEEREEREARGECAIGLSGGLEGGTNPPVIAVASPIGTDTDTDANTTSTTPSRPTRPPFFLDLACGNGFLTYLLTMEGYQGLGIDQAKRAVWDAYPAEVTRSLKAETVDPRVLVDGGIGEWRGVKWVVGNHSGGFRGRDGGERELCEGFGVLR